MKTKLIALTFLCFSISVKAQKPFKELGLDNEVEVLTLSNGRYVEHFANDTLRQIGSVMFNTVTGKVQYFISDADLEKQKVATRTKEVSRFLSIDPLAKNFPSQSPYLFAGNNPIYLIDVDGKYQYPADKAAAYKKAYPMITKYLATQVKSDVLNSAAIVNAFSESTGGNFTKDKVTDAVTWGTGPNIVFDPNPGFPQTGAQGFYEPIGDEIQLNSKTAANLEKILNSDASDEDKMAAFLGFYKTLLHETAHKGNYTDYETKVVKTGEVGDNFEDKVYKSDAYTPGVINMNDKDTAKKVVEEQKKTEEGSKTLPTLPSNDKKQ